MIMEMTVATKYAESIELSTPSPLSPSTPFPSIHNVSTAPSRNEDHPMVLPPPPPPPVPPLPSSPFQSPSSPSLQKSKFKKVNWITIPKDRILGKDNIWTTDKYDDDFQLDTLIMEKLFEQVEKVSGHERKHWRRFKHNCQDSTGERISLLDSRRSMNVGIFLKQFKRSVWEIVEDIKQGTAEGYGAEELTKLLKLLPESEEVKRLKRFEGDQSKLSEADLFMLLLVKVPSYCLHLEAMILKDEFEPQIKSLMTSVCTMIKAAHELRNCDELHAILRLVLKAGNHMNAGGYSGNAAGFRIASLLKLADIKANKPGVNLIHFVAMEAEKRDKKLLSFPDKLEHIGAAARLSEDGIMEELNKLSKRVASLQTDLNEDPELEAQLARFLQTAKEKLKEIWKTMEFFQRMRQSLVEYFCEDEKLKLEEYCTVLKSFCEKFLKAIQENATREIEEQKRQQREKEMVEKRHSIATCSSIEIELGQDDLEISLARKLQSYNMKRWVRRSYKPNFLSQEHCARKTYPSEVERDCDTNDLNSDFSEKEQANLMQNMSEKVLKQQLSHCIMQVGYPILKEGVNTLNQEAETIKETAKPTQLLEKSQQSLPLIKEYPKLIHTAECRTPNKSLKSSENFPLKKSLPTHCSKWKREEQRGEQNVASKRKQLNQSSPNSKKTFGVGETRVDQKNQFAKKPTVELSKVESRNLITNRKSKISSISSKIQTIQPLKGQRTASSLHKAHTSEKPLSPSPTLIHRNLLSPVKRKSITSGKQIAKVKEIKETPMVSEQVTKASRKSIQNQKVKCSSSQSTFTIMSTVSSPKSLSKSDIVTSGSRISYAKQSLQQKKPNPGTDTMVKHQTDSLISKGVGQRSRSLKLNRQPVWR
ncbi:FH2 domain-containing protein 1 [Stegostoma tigrinum]|uniref:FH2 domain-containing protein 1 n=1 Tax=Stegostoma tigrinum TaxID=3053191 RepID=UPI00202AE87B|nr:FH2 domain-containing protein 1 [Stegostoma tigrinum]XP_048400981.1 FH2 domain-containing protein 1 [Stegostoma tigrinum]